MSYDYNALVSQITKLRSDGQKVEAMRVYEELASHCSMTPLLWVQLALDDATSSSSQNILDRGLKEFPGSALLNWFRLKLSVQSSSASMQQPSQSRDAFEVAMLNVGSGSHRNDEILVKAIFDLYVEHLVENKEQDQALEVYLIRASSCPLRQMDESLTAEIQTFCTTHGLEFPTEKLEEGRRRAARILAPFARNEDAVDGAMQAEGVLSRYELQQRKFISDNNSLSRLDARSFALWNGLGGIGTAQAFITYAQALAHYANDEDPEEQQIVRDLAIRVYERGIAECPTVEALWVSYIKYLLYLIQGPTNDKVTPAQLQSVAKRAVRNAPYSVACQQQRFKIQEVLASLNKVVLDPDALLQLAKEAIQSKFLPKHHGKLYGFAIRTVKRRILELLDHDYDLSLPHSTSTQQRPLSDEVEEELQNLVEDLRDMYDTVLETFKKEKDDEGSTSIWRDRTMSEFLIMTPLLKSLDEDEGENNLPVTEASRCCEQLLQVPRATAHIDTVSTAVSVLFAQPVRVPSDIAPRLKKIRGLYQKSFQSFGKKGKKAATSPDDVAAQHVMGRAWLLFEGYVGSDRSLAQATKLIQKKLTDSSPIKAPSSQKRDRQAHAANEDNTHSPPAKKAKVESGGLIKDAPPTMEEPKKADTPPTGSTEDDVSMTEAGAEPQPKLETTSAAAKRKIEQSKAPAGHQKFKAHPFTVRIENLDPSIEDMDLVDLLRPKCGAIVTARVLRDKVTKQSRGCALVQFEERSSAAKALALHDTLGLKERLLQIAPSNLPAAMLVAQQRVQPKGQGKYSRRNERRREARAKKEEGTPEQSASDLGGGKPPPATNVLTFQPRGLKRKKAKMNLKK